MSRINRLSFYCKQLGLQDTLKFLLSKLITVKIGNYKEIQALFSGGIGVEVGGPSDCFNSDNILPIYPVMYYLDNVNFSADTIWSKSPSDEVTFKCNENRFDHQYICDAVDLNLLPSEKYDFLISCNNLEHIANPLKAIDEWLRVIKPKALIFLVLPNQKVNFDHARNVATLAHLIDDYECNTPESDLGHLEEILRLHDLSLDPLAGTLDQFRERSMDNHENRALHHHVFDMVLLRQIFDHVNVKTLWTHTSMSDHFIIGRKD